MQLRALPLPERSPAFSAVTLDVRAACGLRDLVGSLRPRAWVLPVASLACGSVAAGAWQSVVAHGTFLAPGIRLLTGGLLVGPLLTGTIHRSEALPAARRLFALAALMLAFALGAVPSALVAIGLLLGWLFGRHAAHPGERAWRTALLGGISSVALPWLVGASLFAAVGVPAGILAGLFSFGAVGFLILAAFQPGNRSLAAPLAQLLGPDLGLGIAVLLIDTTLVGSAILALGDAPIWATAGLFAMLLAQLTLQGVLLLPKSRNLRTYLRVAFPLFVLAMGLMALHGPLNPFQL